ncbi:MAG: hypothetical protein KGY69_18440, partial [Bacteroidales bacterium]|nr:hypothetical protein [Bacteroidales bacterium]
TDYIEKFFQFSTPLHPDTDLLGVTSGFSMGFSSSTRPFSIGIGWVDSKDQIYVSMFQPCFNQT